MKILLVDDHPLFLAGLHALLEPMESVSTVTLACNGYDALAEMEKTVPDLLITDIEMPEMDGIELCQQVKAKHPQIKVMALTMHQDSGMLQAILRAGADGCVPKHAKREILSQALYAIQTQGSYFEPTLTQSLLKNLSQPKNKTGKPPLSSRELEILTLIAQELTTPEIAQHLHLSPLTIEKHRKNILLKAGARNTAGLIRKAMKKGWIE